MAVVVGLIIHIVLMEEVTAQHRLDVLMPLIPIAVSATRDRARFVKIASHTGPTSLAVIMKTEIAQVDACRDIAMRQFVYLNQVMENFQIVVVHIVIVMIKSVLGQCTLKIKTAVPALKGNIYENLIRILKK